MTAPMPVLTRKPLKAPIAVVATAVPSDPGFILCETPTHIATRTLVHFPVGTVLLVLAVHKSTTLDPEDAMWYYEALLPSGRIGYIHNARPLSQQLRMGIRLRRLQETLNEQQQKSHTAFLG